jgi:hypothetical protein
MAGDVENGERDSAVSEWDRYVMIPVPFVESDASLAARAVYMALMMHANQQSSDRDVWPSYDRLMQCSGIGSRTTISQALDELEEDGWLIRKRQFSKTTIYTLPRRPISPKSGLQNAGEVVQKMDCISPDSEHQKSKKRTLTRTIELEPKNKNQSVARASRGAPPVDAEPVTVQEAEQPTPAPAPTPAKPNLYGDLFVAVSNVCQLDRALPRNAKQIADAAKYLAARSVTPDRLAAFTAWWCANDWRGRRGDLPRPGQITEMWLQFEQGKPATSTAAAPALQRGGSARTFRRDQATADVVRQAEAKAASTSDESDYLWGETDAEAEARHRRMTARAAQGVAS